MSFLTFYCFVLVAHIDNSVIWPGCMAGTAVADEAAIASARSGFVECASSSSAEVSSPTSATSPSKVLCFLFFRFSFSFSSFLLFPSFLFSFWLSLLPSSSFPPLPFPLFFFTTGKLSPPNMLTLGIFLALGLRATSSSDESCDQ